MTRILLGVVPILLAAWGLAAFGLRQGVEIIVAAALVAGFAFAMVWLRVRLTRGCDETSQADLQPNGTGDTRATSERRAA